MKDQSFFLDLTRFGHCHKSSWLDLNISLSTVIFPYEWKAARVTPLYKNSGNHSVPTNLVAKVLERIIYQQLNQYLIKNDFLTHYQSAFRSLHSTVTALLKATDKWAMNIDRGWVNTVVFFRTLKCFRYSWSR